MYVFIVQLRVWQLALGAPNTPPPPHPLSPAIKKRHTCVPYDGKDDGVKGREEANQNTVAFVDNTFMFVEVDLYVLVFRIQSDRVRCTVPTVQQVPVLQ